MTNYTTYKNKPLTELFRNEFADNKCLGLSLLERNQKDYGKDENGDELVIPEGYRLLQLGEEIPSSHGKYSKTSLGTGVWTYHNNKSTMTPIFAMISGWNLAYIIKDN